MATDDILIRFKADTNELKAEFDNVKTSLRGVSTEQKKTADQIKSSSKEINNELKKTASINEAVGQSFKELGGLILAAFSVQQIISFGKESVKAFADAEKTAKILQTAVGVNGGLQKDFEKLIKQSKELEAISIFSDDDIQKAQTMALQFGLTTKQVEQLIPVVTNFASATGQTLAGALDKVLAGIRGQGRALKDYQIEVSATGTKAENLRIITDQLNKSFTGQAEIVGKTTFGAMEKLKNQFNNFQEDVGGFIASVGEATASIILWIKNGFQPLDDSLDKTGGKLDEISKKIGQSIPASLIRQQIKQFQALGEAIPEQLINDLKQINFDKFNEEIAALDDKALIKKFEDINAETIRFIQIGDLSKQDRLNAVNEEIKARQAAGKLINEQNQKEVKDNTEAIQKDAKERMDAQAALAKFTFDEQNKNADKQAAERKKDAQETIESEKLLQLELLKIDEDTLKIKLQNAKDTFQDTSAIEIAITDNLRAQAKLRQDILKGGGEIHPNKEDYDKWLKDSKDASDEFKKIQRENLLAVLEAVAQVSNEINGLLQANTDAEIESINARRDAYLESVDEQIAKLEEQHEKGRIGEQAFEKKKQELISQRAAAEKKYNDQVKKEKQEQAKIDKALAIFNIILNTARAVIAALATVPPNPFLAALAATVGATELGIAIATPIPAFAKGTKGKRSSGLARVGEQGEEIVFLPTGAKVLPAQKTREYSDVLDSMFDGKLDAYIHKNYVLPALKLQSPNVNINIDYKKLAKANGQRSSISIDNLHELADMFDHNPRRVI